jgi:hypothetical protein
MTQEELVEIAMFLEATPGGAETLVGSTQVKSQLANLTMQLQDMENSKVVHKNVWCTKCLLLVES